MSVLAQTKRIQSRKPQQPEDLLEQIRERLANDGNFRFKNTGVWFSEGICPQCGKKKLYASVQKPFVVKCNRGSCGYMEKTKTIYSDIFHSLRQSYPATKEQPHLTAEMYLRTRGFDPVKWRGCFQQFTFRQGGQLYPTVRFQLSHGGWWEKIIDATKGQGRDSNYPPGQDSYAGQVWVPPGLEMRGTIVITEGIFNAMALNEIGIQAIATTSCHNIPYKWMPEFKNYDVRWLIGYDNDTAGITGAKKLKDWMHEQSFKSGVLALPPRGQDWNDLLMAGQMEDPQKVLDEALYRGQLASAITAEEYYIIADREKHEPRIFDFNGATYAGSYDDKAGYKVRMIANFTLALRYSRMDESVQEKPVKTRLFDVTLDHHQHRLVLGAEELSSAMAFKTSVMKQCDGLWTGSQAHLDIVLGREFSRDVVTVRQVPTIGYDKQSDCYIFSSVAYDHEGRLHRKTEEGFFSIGPHRLSSTVQEAEIDFDPQHNPEPWYMLLKEAYGYKALTALGFYAASLFAEQFYGFRKFFPFLSLHGHPQTGKSTLWKGLHHVFGRDISEGMSLNKINTAKGEMRTLAKLSNLPLAFLEINRDDQGGVVLGSMLTLYNREKLQTKALKTHDLSTSEIPLKATLAFIQNFESFDEEAQKSRVLSVFFDITEVNAHTRQALLEFETLERERPEYLAGFRHLLLTHRQQYLKLLLDNWGVAEALLRKETRLSGRVCEVHALAFAGWAALSQLFLPEEHEAEKDHFLDYLKELAIKKEHTLKQDTSPSGHFLETLRRILAEKPQLNHLLIEQKFTSDGLLSGKAAVCLVELQEVFTQRGLGSLFNHLGALQGSLLRSPALVDRKPMWSPKLQTTKRLWLFNLEQPFTEP